MAHFLSGFTWFWTGLFVGVAFMTLASPALLLGVLLVGVWFIAREIRRSRIEVR